MLQPMSLPTQIRLLFLGVIHKIFFHLGASYPSMPRLSWLVKLYENLT